MDKHASYAKNIQTRNKKRFLIGILARLKNFIKNTYAVYTARRNGATIGKYVSLPISLAKRANKNLKVGNHTSIQSNKLDLRAPITIGNFTIIGSEVEIITCSHNVDSADWEHKAYGIIIEDYVWLATKSLILPSCTLIGRGAVISAGSVVTKKVLPMHIMSGNPAILLRERKEVHHNLCVEGLLGNDLKTYINVRKNILE